MSRARAFFTRWRWLWIALAIGLVTVGLKFALLMLGESYGRPIPMLAAAPWVVLVAVPIAMIASGSAAFGRHEGTLPRVGLVLLHLVLTAGIGIGGLMTEPDFPFGDSLEATLSLPGDRGTAYLYRGGLLCSRSVWIAAPGALFSQKAPHGPSAGCKEEDAAISWDARSGRVVITGPDGRPIGPDIDWGRAFDWRPH